MLVTGLSAQAKRYAPGAVGDNKAQHKGGHNNMARMREGECKRTRRGQTYCKRGGRVRFVRGGRRLSDISDIAAFEDLGARRRRRRTLLDVGSFVFSDPVLGDCSCSPRRRRSTADLGEPRRRTRKSRPKKRAYRTLF